MGIDRTTGKMHAACGHFHDEEQIECDQSSRRPDLDRGEVDGAQYIPMGPEKLLPG